MKADTGSIFRPFPRILEQTLVLNGIVFGLVLAARFRPGLAFWGGALIIAYLTAQAFVVPERVFFLVFGLKLTYDALWFIKVPGLESVGLLELFLLPVLVIGFIGLRSLRPSSHRFLLAALLYVIWATLAMMLNGFYPDVALIIRQSSLLMGLVLGFAYIRREIRLELTLYLVFLSTVIPVAAAIIQFGLDRIGISIFYSKVELSRGVRLSGLYYDSATAGMVCLISMAANFYILHRRLYLRGTRGLHVLFLGLSSVAVIVGQTRAIIVGMALVVFVFALVDWRRTIRLLPMMGLAALALFPYLRAALERTTVWERPRLGVAAAFNIADALSETEYRTLFAGRVAIWQDIWDEFSAGSGAQKLLGSGVSSNAHSSYVFLLLQLGWGGVALYLGLNMALFRRMWRWRRRGLMPKIGLLALGLVLGVGVSATTVLYTSFQWINYLIIGGVLSIETSRRIVPVPPIGEF